MFTSGVHGKTNVHDEDLAVMKLMFVVMHCDDLTRW